MLCSHSFTVQLCFAFRCYVWLTQFFFFVVFLQCIFMFFEGEGRREINLTFMRRCWAPNNCALNDISIPTKIVSFIKKNNGFAVNRNINIFFRKRVSYFIRMTWFIQCLHPLIWWVSIQSKFLCSSGHSVLGEEQSPVLSNWQNIFPMLSSSAPVLTKFRRSVLVKCQIFKIAWLLLLYIKLQRCGIVCCAI